MQLTGRPALRDESARASLRSDRDAVLRAAGIKDTVVDYETVFNGFAAELTEAQRRRLASTDGVQRLWKNERRTVDTISTPAFLGLAGAGGAWESEFGDPEHAGEGVIIADIDTGFWPESPSLAAMPEPRPDQALIDRKWKTPGVDKCQEGTGAPATQVTCNNKVIGARFYNHSGFGDWTDEYQSPRDYDGHGTHTATTAAGLHDVLATINGESVGKVSGMAPGARIAVYKALWRQEDGDGSGGTVDLLAAINDAVADGVDVINYSVSGSSASVVDPIGLAFFNAAAAGVFVAASAGNDGPDKSTVAHNAPWETTVAASSHDRGAVKSAILGDGKTWTGVGQGPAVADAPLIDSVNAGAVGATADKVELCYEGALDKAKVTGKIVLCKRGVNPRTDKSRAVRAAGGVGMILYNPEENSLNADYHVLPTVHVDHVAGAAIKAYAAKPGAHAALSATTAEVPRAPAVAAFSAAGPADAGDGDLIKPDLAAPGVDIVAAVSPAGHHGNLFDGESGTSMSSPHIAGIAALVRAKHPDWSPAAVKSALMTTAGQTDNSGGAIRRSDHDANPFDYGSGQVRPAKAFDPGLVYEAGASDWARYACSIKQMQQVSDWCTVVGEADPSDLNYPSIGIGSLPGAQTVTRTVTNVSGLPSVYVAAVTPPPGTTVVVSPQTITVPAGGTVSFKVTVRRTTAAFREYTFGAFTWTDLRGHVVRSPIAVRPVALAGPGEITGSGAAGHSTIELRGGYAGTVTAHPYGLAASTVYEQKLVGSTAAFVAAAPGVAPSIYSFEFTLPATFKLGRLSTFAADHAAGTDLDLYLYQNGELITKSDGPTADEEIPLNGGSGTYQVFVVQFGLPPTLTEQLARAHLFVVDAKATGNLTVSPRIRPVTPDEQLGFDVDWTGLDPKKRYLGMIEFGDLTAARAWTTVAVGPQLPTIP